MNDEWEDCEKCGGEGELPEPVGLLDGLLDFQCPDCKGNGCVKVTS